MTANDLYHELIEQGFILSVNGERLTLSPSSQLTDDLRAKIRIYKADLMALLASNDHHEKIVASEVCPKLDAPIHHPKSAVENSRLTQSEETYPHIEDRPPTWSMDRYAHMVKCQQCEHLTPTGYCRVKPQYKPIPEAMIDCASFGALKSDRTSEVRNEPYTQSELNALLGDCEKKLFHHFVKGCDGCSFMESRYCVDAFAIGSSYDALLMVFEDAASKREALLNTVIRARISGRKVFVGIDYTDMGEPPQQTVKPLVYGIGDSERLFVNHLMTCNRCKPVSRTYCGEGVRLQGWLPHQRRD
jgi:hypothetical protein